MYIWVTMNSYIIKYTCFIILTQTLYSCNNTDNPIHLKTLQTFTIDTLSNTFLWYEVKLNTEKLGFFWKDKLNYPYSNFKNLRQNFEQENKTLIFAMNGGMYLKDQSPQGLYIENGEILSPIDTTQIAYGNFYMQPNGIFYVTKQNDFFVVKTENFILNKNIKYATQSGPMLLIDGKYHSKFQKKSKSKYIRNGVGILPNGNVIFCMSKAKINFYNFAKFFKDKGCENALYLDGFVSRTYLPEQNWYQLDGKLGVIIGAWE